jgi:hypothetical protein
MKTIKQREVVEYKCDYCHEEMQFDTITVIHGYPSDYDTETWHFCCMEHLTKYIEYRKKNPKKVAPDSW